jgi:hypothetical protein
MPDSGQPAKKSVDEKNNGGRKKQRGHVLGAGKTGDHPAREQKPRGAYLSYGEAGPFSVPTRLPDRW